MDSNDEYQVENDLDLLHHYQDINFGDYENNAARSATSPWSAFNSRVVPDELPPFDAAIGLHTFNDPLSLHPPSQSFKESFTSLGTGLRCASPDSATPSPPPSPPPPQESLTTSSAFVLPILAADKHGKDNVAVCRQCGQEFTGKFRRGNLARHARQKHIKSGASRYPCTAYGCEKKFQRPDARLKHSRSKHPELHVLPGQQRRVAEDLTYNIGQWTQGENLSLGDNAAEMSLGYHSITRCEGFSRAADCVFKVMQANLEPTTYFRFRDSFFSRWESIVGYLHDNRSLAHPIYAKVLEHIHLVVRAIDLGLSGTTTAASNDFRNQASRWQRTEPRTNDAPVASASGPSRVDKVSRRSGRKRPVATGDDRSVHITLASDENKAVSKKVDCPVYKHHVMHDTTPPCNGCRVSVMSQVRSHLNPSRAATHGGFPSFVQQCPRCKQDFIERGMYEGHRATDTCVFRSQARGDIVLSWALQYLALYPTATRIPLPWSNERGWLPDSVSTRCHARYQVPVPDIPSPSQHQSDHTLPPASLSADVPTEDQSYRIAMTHVLEDALNPTFIQSTTSLIPVHNPTRQSTTAIAAASTPRADVNLEQWQTVLQSFQLHQSTLRQAAAHLNPQQLLYMARECELIYNVFCGLYQQPSSHLFQE